jgi:hypothetical protein
MNETAAPALFAVLAMCCSLASAAEIGQVKVVRGQVDLERNGQTLPAKVGMRLETADVLRTGADGAVGITMADNSLLSAGSNSILSLDRFDYDPTTNQGRFDTAAAKGSLSVISGGWRSNRRRHDGAHARRRSSACGARNSSCPHE